MSLTHSPQIQECLNEYFLDYFTLNIQLTIALETSQEANNPNDPLMVALRNKYNLIVVSISFQEFIEILLLAVTIS